MDYIIAIIRDVGSQPKSNLLLSGWEEITFPPFYILIKLTQLIVITNVNLKNKNFFRRPWNRVMDAGNEEVRSPLTRIFSYPGGDPPG